MMASIVYLRNTCSLLCHTLHPIYKSLPGTSTSTQLFAPLHWVFSLGSLRLGFYGPTSTSEIDCPIKLHHLRLFLLLLLLLLLLPLLPLLLLTIIATSSSSSMAVDRALLGVKRQHHAFDSSVVL